ncbi:MAG: hypothetical protein EOO65_04360, partial [Methanosarcinales archaeon]
MHMMLTLSARERQALTLDTADEVATLGSNAGAPSMFTSFVQHALRILYLELVSLPSLFQQQQFGMWWADVLAALQAACTWVATAVGELPCVHPVQLQNEAASKLDACMALLPPCSALEASVHNAVCALRADAESFEPGDAVSRAQRLGFDAAVSVCLPDDLCLQSAAEQTCSEPCCSDGNVHVVEESAPGRMAAAWSAAWVETCLRGIIEGAGTPQPTAGYASASTEQLPLLVIMWFSVLQSVSADEFALVRQCALDRIVTSAERILAPADSTAELGRPSRLGGNSQLQSLALQVLQRSLPKWIYKAGSCGWLCSPPMMCAVLHLHEQLSAYVVRTTAVPSIALGTFQTSQSNGQPGSEPHAILLEHDNAALAGTNIDGTTGRKRCRQEAQAPAEGIATRPMPAASLPSVSTAFDPFDLCAEPMESYCARASQCARDDDTVPVPTPGPSSSNAGSGDAAHPLMDNFCIAVHLLSALTASLQFACSARGSSRDAVERYHEHLFTSI